MNSIPEVEYKISGIIKDSVSGQTIPFVSFALFYSADSLLATGAISDENGLFVIEVSQPGDFYLEISVVGFQKKYISNLSLTTVNPLLDLGIINIAEETIELNEVVVQAGRTAIEYKVDRKIVNVSELGIPENATMTQALQILPSVQSDENGNMTLRGSGNFIVLVDGKPTLNSGIDVLQQYTAAQIERVEIITNPSSRYNADNTSGIINLILKKNTGLGVSAFVSVGTSRGENHLQPITLNSTISYKRKKFSLSGTFNFNNPQYDFVFTTQQRRETGTDLDIFSTNNVRWSRWRSSFDIDYYVSKKNTISLSGRKMSDDYTFNIRATNHVVEVQDSSFLSQVAGPIDRGGSAITLQDVHAFDENGNELRLLATYFNERIDESQLFSEYSNHDQPYRRRYSGNQHNQNEFRTEVDYSKPSEGGEKLELGSSLIATSRDVNRFVEEIEPVLLRKEHHFSFKSKTVAAYSTWSGQLYTIDVKGGLRAEYFDREIEQRGPDKIYTFNQLSLFPSLSFTKKIKDQHQVQVSYSRRIRRPSINELRPYTDWSDNVRSYGGNPDLIPATINSFEVSYIRYLKKLTATLDTYLRKTKNDIADGERLNSDTGIIEGLPINIEKSSFYGVESSFEMEVTKWWKIRGSGTYFQNAMTGEIFETSINRRFNGWRLRLNQTIILSEIIRLNINSFYNSRILTPLGREEKQYWLDLAFTASFLNKKGTFSLNVSDVLNTRIYKRMNSGMGFHSHLELDLPSPVFSININYTFNNYNTRKNRVDFEY